MKNYNYNVSSLFGGMQNDSLFGSVNFTDYASIKNGSYGKLLKAYYAEEKESQKVSSEGTKTDSSKKTKATDTTGLSQLKSDADSLKKAAEALGEDKLWEKKDGEYDLEKITGAVKSFVSEYNNTLTQAGKVNSKDASRDASNMSSLSGVMLKTLSRAGISVRVDGMLSVSDDSLKKADMGNLKSLFTGKVSYGSQVADKAGAISKDAVMGSSLYESNGALSSSIASLFDQWI